MDVSCVKICFLVSTISVVVGLKMNIQTDALFGYSVNMMPSMNCDGYGTSAKDVICKGHLEGSGGISYFDNVSAYVLSTFGQYEANMAIPDSSQVTVGGATNFSTNQWGGSYSFTMLPNSHWKTGGDMSMTTPHSSQILTQDRSAINVNGSLQVAGQTWSALVLQGNSSVTVAGSTEISCVPGLFDTSGRAAIKLSDGSTVLIKNNVTVKGGQVEVKMSGPGASLTVKGDMKLISHQDPNLLTFGNTCIEGELFVSGFAHDVTFLPETEVKVQKLTVGANTDSSLFDQVQVVPGLQCDGYLF